MFPTADDLAIDLWDMDRSKTTLDDGSGSLQKFLDLLERFAKRPMAEVALS